MFKKRAAKGHIRQRKGLASAPDTEQVGAEDGAVLTRALEMREEQSERKRFVSN